MFFGVAATFQVLYSMTMVKDLRVDAYFDEHSDIWVAESEQIPGLAAKAKTLEALFAKLSGLVPELLRLNVGELDKSELDGAAIDLNRQLMSLEADIPPEELEAWFAAFDRAAGVSQ